MDEIDNVIENYTQGKEIGTSKSGHHGHKGIPGHQGGSAPSGSSTPGESFEGASDKVIQDAKSGKLSGEWEVYSGQGTAKLELPDGGRAILSFGQDRTVTGKYVAGTTSQQRYNVFVRITTYKKDPSNLRTELTRWDSFELWTTRVKFGDLATARKKGAEKFNSLLKGIS